MVTNKGSAIKLALASLSDEDRAAAEKQVNCPKSGEPLGSMGTPIKVTVNDRDIWICCKACESDVKKEFDTYLAKLEPAEAAPEKEQEETPPQP